MHIRSCTSTWTRKYLVIHYVHGCILYTIMRSRLSRDSVAGMPSLDGTDGRGWEVRGWVAKGLVWKGLGCVARFGLK